MREEVPVGEGQGPEPGQRQKRESGGLRKPGPALYSRSWPLDAPAACHFCYGSQTPLITVAQDRG